MIHYKSNRWCVSVYHLSLTFNLKAMQGAGFISLGVAMVSLALSFSDEYLNSGLMGTFLAANTTVYTTLSGSLSLLVVFRTSQAYARYWDGSTLLHQMSGDWFDAASTVLSFCKYSKEDSVKIEEFQQLFVRLMSLLNAMILAELEGHNVGDDSKCDVIYVKNILGANAMEFELLHPDAIDPKYIERVQKAKHKAEMVFQWIQNLIIENIVSGVLSIPPPLLTRTFQDLGSGMMHYHDALKYSDTPFPFPYTCATEILLMVHWLYTPIFVCTLTDSRIWVVFLSIMLVFVLWSLHLIAGELENPFGDDRNDLNMSEMQVDMNESLASLISVEAQETPKLAISCQMATRSLRPDVDDTRRLNSRKSFAQILNRRSLGKVRASFQKNIRVSRTTNDSRPSDTRRRSERLSESSVVLSEIFGAATMPPPPSADHWEKGSGDDVVHHGKVSSRRYAGPVVDNDDSDTSPEDSYSSERTVDIDGGCSDCQEDDEYPRVARTVPDFLTADVADEDIAFWRLPRRLWRINLGRRFVAAK